MPLQNRVTPANEIIATPHRGLMMGNRGILHGTDRTLGVARWTHPHWISCVTAFKGRRRELMRPGRYTELFFLDEAVALAAGHRPCGECRRADLKHFLALWQQVHGGEIPKAGDLDRHLHKARIDGRRRRQIRHTAPIDDLPDGTFIAGDGPDDAFLVLGDRLLPYSPAGYGPAERRPTGVPVSVMTPRPIVAALNAGYRPIIHPSAG
ncbi:MAG: hypothetical protein C0606_14870 [Hyphomicrobiales bacterium]|nr:MAG: hypothetical protein C0606_14870 [Hyphomicrobiales bacterium]